LDEVGAQAGHGLLEGLVVRLLPARRAHPLAHVGGLAEDAAEEAAGRLQGPGHGAQRGCLETGSEPGAAAIAEELELEAAVGAQVAVVAGELDLLGHLGLRDRRPASSRAE